MNLSEDTAADGALMCYGKECLHVTQLRAVMVEPSPTQQKIISQQLESQGIIDITPFQDGASSLEHMQNVAPDLVISAMYLPDMIGTDLIHKMRADDALSTITFLLVSSETDIRALEPIRQAGAIGILPKPFSVRDLQRALCATVDLCYPSSDAALPPAILQPCKVLLVDDSQFSRNHIRRVLSSLNLQDIDEAINGEEAIALIKRRHYDLILTDYNMPVMDGSELVDYIRNQSTQSNVPIMMITSEQDCGRLAAIEQCGVSALCDKPFEPRAIRNLLERLLVSQH